MTAIKNYILDLANTLFLVFLIGSFLWLLNDMSLPRHEDFTFAIAFTALFSVIRIQNRR